jgi:hypothetical protein
VEAIAVVTAAVDWMVREWSGCPGILGIFISFPAKFFVFAKNSSFEIRFPKGKKLR